MNKEVKKTVFLDPTNRLFCSESPFALFFQSVLRTVMERTGSLIAEDPPNTNAKMWYPLDSYFSLPETKCSEVIKLVPPQ